MAPPSKAQLKAKFDESWTHLQSITDGSQTAELEKYASYYTEDCKANLNGMTQPTSHGRNEVIEMIKGLVKYWHVDERRVTSEAWSEDGLTLVAEMKNKLNIAGETVDPFYETEVVDFDAASGLVKNYRLYTDPTPVMEVLKKKGFM